ncbi:MAG TPA: acyl--CoA ligase [Candidatus Binataceae bacterium]|nr:acyl--CoA ligase [Candidatus Binataceae bacterium]
MRDTLAKLIDDPRSAEPAIISLEPALSITYRDLAEASERLAAELAARGLRPGDCAAMFLPNSLEFIELFLALTRLGITVAPLNPAFRVEELKASLMDNRARALLARAGDATAAEAARELGVQLWSPELDARGAVTLDGATPRSLGAPPPPAADQAALLLQTSGSTGRPKMVPLTQANLLASALDIAAHYALSPADRTLLVMPLFHGHGLIGAALSTLSSGGTLIVPPRFSAASFWSAFQAYGATWYTAVPTIHLVLLARADGDGAPYHGPRFIRSCSASLAPAVLGKLEERFGAPVIEAYGMTETTHQAASNPLPPRPHKPGSVGLPTGVEIAIIDPTGKRLGANQAGEVIVRGPKVMTGYRDNPRANLEAFMDGWFRSGDMGVCDADGYLTLTGRLKELINRGGEKIAPNEIEATLLRDSAVAEASVFGMPDPKYGEVVWAAVVLKGDTDAARLKRLCREYLADFKVPVEIRFVAALPRNATGKVVRRDVAAMFRAAG